MRRYEPRQMNFRLYEPCWAPSLLAAWNRWLPSQYALDSRLLAQLTIDHASWDPRLARLAFDGEDLLGFVLARRHPGQPRTIIDAVAVHPDHRRGGVARELLSNVSTDSLRFGGGPAHFVPGLPSEWTAGEAFFEALGFVPDWQAEDLHLELGQRSGPFLGCSQCDKDAVLGMIGQEFSTRWTDDTAARFEHGDAADVVVIKEGGEPIAFCQIWHYQSHLLGPSVFWLRHQCPTFGGIGPVGVRQAFRGRGLGFRVVEEALNALAHRGVTEVVVDWTSIGAFYEKNGFRRWRTYRGYSQSLGACS